MAKIRQIDLLAYFKKVDANTLNLLTPADKLHGLFSNESLEPENKKPAEADPNQILISVSEQKKKGHHNTKTLKVGKQESQNQEHEERHKVYRPGPFALFYELNEGKLEKDQEVWYFKEKKQIIGPVSSYNMDKMVYFHTIQDQTKVAFKNVDKFVKFMKINAIVEKQKQ